MIVTGNENYIYGSSALAPKEKPYYPTRDDEYEKRKREEEEKRRALIRERADKKAKVIKSVLLAFIVGVILICRYSAVYKLQRQLLDVKTEMHNLTMENENLKVELLKAGNMEQVEEIAKTKLHMITPDKNNIMYVQGTKDYFAKATEEDNSTKEDLIAKIKNLLF